MTKLFILKKIMPEKDNKSSNYTAKSITVLEGLEPVRKRPGMYIGSTGTEGLHHLIWEVVDNSFDEAMGGHCDHIVIKILPDDIIQVSDNGRGIPVEIHKQAGVSALEVVMTKLHAGGKFGGDGYKISGGLHGVGVSVVNALSTMLRATVRRDGKIYQQEYSIGVPKTKVKAIGNIKIPFTPDPLNPENSFKTGTTQEFKPDKEIFSVTEFSWEKILNHLRQQAYLTKKIRLTLFDLRNKENPLRYTFYFDGGIKSYCKHLNKNDVSKHENIFYCDKELEGVRVEIALRYTEEFQETLLAFANNIYNLEGGTHVIGFKTALTRTINNYGRKNNILKEKDENLTGDDVREGLTGIISVKIPDPQFEGQTKAKLGNPEVKNIVDQVFSEEFSIFLEEHPKDAEAIISKSMLAAQARRASKAARETVLRKGVLDGLALPGKLADCSSKDATLSELFIVEGDSAGGSAKQGRNREFQAILPLRGKILNAEKARIDRMLTSDALKSLIIALGANFGEMFNIANLRYQKIFIMTDADPDGAHIRTLLLTFFYRHFPDLVNSGFIYIAMPPLYKIQKGSFIRYAFTEDELDKAKAEYFELEKTKAKNKKLSKGKDKTKVEEKLTEAIEGEELADAEAMAGDEVKFDVQRYKGLGEMNPEQLWDTTMNPETRLIRKVTVEDAEKADEIFDILMGSEVAPRKKFIQTRAKQVQNLDV